MPLNTAVKAKTRYLVTKNRIGILFNNVLGFYRSSPRCQRHPLQKPGCAPGFLMFSEIVLLALVA